MQPDIGPKAISFGGSSLLVKCMSKLGLSVEKYQIEVIELTVTDG